MLKDFLEIKVIKITYYGAESISRLRFLNHSDNCGRVGVSLGAKANGDKYAEGSEDQEVREGVQCRGTGRISHAAFRASSAINIRMGGQSVCWMSRSL